MAYTPIVIGSLAWGTPVNNAFTSQDARISVLESKTSPSSWGNWIATSYDPALAAANTLPTSGTVTMVRLDLAAPATITSAVTCVVAVGVTLTAGQNFAGLYDSTGTRVAVTADQSVAWTSLGEKVMTFTSPYAAAAGTYYVAYLANGATTPAILRSSSNANISAVINRGQSVSVARFALGPTAQTTLPASITMASRTLGTTSFFAGVI